MHCMRRRRGGCCDRSIWYGTVAVFPPAKALGKALGKHRRRRTAARAKRPLHCRRSHVVGAHRGGLDGLARGLGRADPGVEHGHAGRRVVALAHDDAAVGGGRPLVLQNALALAGHAGRDRRAWRRGAAGRSADRALHAGDGDVLVACMIQPRPTATHSAAVQTRLAKNSNHAELTASAGASQRVAVVRTAGSRRRARRRWPRRRRRRRPRRARSRRPVVRANGGGLDGLAAGAGGADAAVEACHRLGLVVGLADESALRRALGGRLLEHALRRGGGAGRQVARAHLAREAFRRAKTAFETGDCRVLVAIRAGTVEGIAVVAVARGGRGSGRAGRRRRARARRRRRGRALAVEAEICGAQDVRSRSRE